MLPYLIKKRAYKKKRDSNSKTFFLKQKKKIEQKNERDFILCECTAFGSSGSGEDRKHVFLRQLVFVVTIL